MNDYTLGEEILFRVIVLIPFAVVCTYLFHTQKLFSYMKQHHHDLWVEMGSPNVISNNTISNTHKFLAYLGKKKWLEIGDPTLIKKSNMALRWFRLSFVFILILALLAGIGGMH